MNKQVLNLSVGLFSSAWSAASSLLVVPIYLKYLGIEAYGLIGFFLMLQALFQILDMGFAPTLNREVARSLTPTDIRSTRNLMHTLATIYWGMSLAIAAVVLLGASFISDHWLNSSSLSSETLRNAVVLMGLVIAVRWPLGLYAGALLGAQKLATSSLISIIVSTLSNFGAVVVLSSISSTVEAFFIWQIFVGLISVMAFRQFAWSAVKSDSKSIFDFSELMRVWKFSLGMIALTLSAVIFTQVDKVLLSSMIGLEEFATYMLAVSAAGSLSLVVAPFYNLVFPFFTNLFANDEQDKLFTAYRVSSRLISTILFSLAMVIMVFPEELIGIWVRNQELAVKVAPIVSLLVFGSAIHGVMHVPHALQLACGKVRLPIVINAILLCLIVPLMIFLVEAKGAVGGAMAWVCLHIVYMCLGTFLTHRVLFVGQAISWLFFEVLSPFAIAGFVGGVGYLYVKHHLDGALSVIFCAALMVFISIFLSVFTSSSLRSIVLAKIRASNG